MFEKKGNVSLMFHSWIPFNVNKSKLILSLTHLYQTFALIITAMSTIASECFAMLIILQIGGQLDIMLHRLNLLSFKQLKTYPEFIKYRMESKIIRNCVEHHNYLFALVERIYSIH